MLIPPLYSPLEAVLSLITEFFMTGLEPFKYIPPPSALLLEVVELFLIINDSSVGLELTQYIPPPQVL